MASAATEPQPPPFHVLAVDDSLPDRKLIEKLLKTSSYQGTPSDLLLMVGISFHRFVLMLLVFVCAVTSVDSGSKALQFLEQQPSAAQDTDAGVNLIITDYSMPGMTGYDLLKKIKESSSFRDIPVVIMSSDNNPSRINRCLEEGADEFLIKPVRLADMNRLKPHILKSRSREQQQLKLQTTTTISANSSISSSMCNGRGLKRKTKEDSSFPQAVRQRLGGGC